MFFKGTILALVLLIIIANKSLDDFDEMLIGEKCEKMK